MSTLTNRLPGLEVPVVNEKTKNFRFSGNIKFRFSGNINFVKLETSKFKIQISGSG